jgi:hypothetical protein
LKSQTASTVKFGSRCNEGQIYFKFPPHPTIKNPQCTGCGGCDSRLYHFPDGTSLEYLGVEHIDDQHIISAFSSSTQENVIRYLKLDPPKLLVVNAGIHFRSDEIQNFSSRFSWYVDQLSRISNRTQLVWITTSATRPATFQFVPAVNDLAKNILITKRIPFLDAYNISSQMRALMTDIVHFHGRDDIYYRTIRDLLISWFCSLDTGSI